MLLGRTLDVYRGRKTTTKQQQAINPTRYTIQGLYCEFSALIGAHIVAQNEQTNQIKERIPNDRMWHD